MFRQVFCVLDRRSSLYLYESAGQDWCTPQHALLYKIASSIKAGYANESGTLFLNVYSVLSNLSQISLPQQSVKPYSTFVCNRRFV